MVNAADLLRNRVRTWTGILFCSAALTLWLNAQSPDYRQMFDEHWLPQVEEVLLRGQYESVEVASREGMNRGKDQAAWKYLRFQALSALGQRDNLREELPQARSAHPDHLPMLILIHDLWMELGEPEKAAEILTGFNDAALKKPLKDRTAAELVALGKGAYLLGAEPERVLNEFFGAAEKKDPKYLSTWMAAGNLALKKYDYARAAREFRDGLKQSAQHPDLRFGLARALYPSDREAALRELDKVLSYNDRHKQALVLKAEHLMNSERYDEASVLLQAAQGVDENFPDSWALQSVIYTMRDNNMEAATEARERALEAIPENAEVEHLIGRCLSHRYRFAEGAIHQRQALEWDPDYNAARMQLSNDLMRLGQEEEAWELAEAVHDSDPYNVLAFNYMQLRDQLEKYATLEDENFRIRMHPDELKIYGDRALELLTEAYDVLCEKYGLERLEQQTTVEFFQEQQDFAIRTFGELGGAGYLGVCFGPVITMNSPGSSASGFSNWEATLWHEFCHVVTLTATRNRMPRWLSEGISVHEETERMPQWGQRMTPDYRRRILEQEGGITPISQLSSAFLNARDGDDLMFAYFQSALVVDFFLQEFGQKAFNDLLADLGGGTPINPALEAAFEEMASMEEKFVAFAGEKAGELGPDVDWSIPLEIDPRNGELLAGLVETQPKNFQIRQWYTIHRLEAEDWPAAEASARAFIELLPEYVEEQNGYSMLAQALHQQGKVEEEAAVLRDLATRSADAVMAYQRLLEIDLEAENWDPLLAMADKKMAVDPFSRKAHYCRGCAARELGKPEDAVTSFQKLLHLGPENPAEIHLELGQLLQESDREASRRHVLDALMVAPRYREAHHLLLRLQRPEMPAAGEEAAIPEEPAPSPMPPDTAE